MNVAGRVALGVIAAEVLACQRGLNGFHFLRRDRAPRQPPLSQQTRDASRMLKAFAVTVNMQDALLLQVKVDTLGLSPRKQVLTRGNRQAGRLDGVGLVPGNAGDELGKPGQFVPTRLGVDQQRCVLAQHPFETLDQGRRMGPGFGIGGRELTAIGKGGLHGRIAMPLEQGDRKTTTGQAVGGGHTRDTAADDCKGLHEVRSKSESRPRCARQTPPLFGT